MDTQWYFGDFRHPERLPDAGRPEAQVEDSKLQANLSPSTS